ncbi:amino acid adenylation domain-containing protein [Kitasatospora sp. NPDC005748]|uniref:amino acid adenylation domain-containing protein n=1 Tax=Kitasatospora sp. NPDC005748 TaxID=3157063 RepID=UPI0033F5308C
MTDTTDRTRLRQELLRRRLAGRAGTAPAEGIARAPRGGPLPLSFAQRRLWILDRLQPGSTEYLVTASLRLTGPLDRAALRTALDGIQHRHEVLRTRYPVVDGEPVQVVDAPSVVPLTEEDLSTLDRAAADARLADLATGARRPVDLAEGPVLSAVLARLAPREHVVLLTVHHIACDGWSEDLLVGELAERYDDAVAGRPARTPDLPVQYADYAVWQRERLSDGALRRRLDHWNERLAALAPLELPTDRPRPPVRDAAGALVPLVVPAATAGRLTALARDHGATPFMALLAAHAVLLGRWSGQRDVAVGSPVAGRDRAEVQDVVGLFLNTLVLRVDLAGPRTFAELLSQVRETALDAYGHQEVPFERLVEELAPERDPARTPLFSSMLLWQDAAGASTPAAMGGLTVERLPVGESTAKFDLTVGLAAQPDGSLAGGVNYASALFDRATAERFAAQFTQLLEHAVAEPDTPLDELEILPREERERQLLSWNATGRGYPTGTLPLLFEAQVARTPNATALRFEGAELSYRELDVRANQLAHHLRRLGVGPESVVGVCLHRGADLVVALLAVLKAGGAYLPLDPDYPADRLAFMLADSGALAVVTDPGLTPLVTGGAPHLVDITAELPGGWGHDPVFAAAPEHPAYLIYTSGSTGRPKGVLVEHRAIVNRLHWMQEAYGLDADDRVLQKTPYSFDVSVWEFFWPLITGATLVLARPGGHRDPAYLAELIGTERITTLHFVPSMLRAFLAEPLPPLPSLRRMVCSGEALPAELVTAVHERIGCELHNLYGPTEAAVDVTAIRCEPGRPVTIGRPISNTRTYIVDAALRPQPIGVPGELLLGGVQLARGYLNRAELTADRFVPDPFATEPGGRLYRTGDLARYRANGEIEYLGRLDHQVKIRGQRVELGEIEAVLAQAPGVAAAAVAVHDDQLVGYLVPAGADVEAAREHLRGRLPEHMRPVHWTTLETLPLTPSGKTDRKALPAPDRTRSELVGAFVAPRSALEQTLADAFAAALGVDKVGVHDGFFQLGGDSMRAIRAVGALRDQGLALSVQDVFARQTVAELAPLAADRPAAGAAETALVGRFELLDPADRERLPEGLADAYPMGQVQVGMVYEMLADPERNTYQNASTFQIVDDGPFSAEALNGAVRLLIERHEILRTSFDLSGYSEPLQLVHAADDLHLEIGVDDLRHLPAEEQQAAVRRFRAEAQRTPFDVGRAPLLRYHAHLVGDREWLLTHVECHAILDGWSHHSVIGELRAAYRELAAGTGAPAAAPPEVRYADFIQLEKRALASPADREFWRGRITGHDRLRLPADTAPAEAHLPATEVRLPWAALEPKLRRLAADTQSSLKTVLYTAHLKVLGLLSGQRRFLAGAVTNGRPELPGGDRVRGMYLNTVPFAVDLRAPSWRELVRSVFAEELALWPHRRYPLPAMQREWGGGEPLVEVVFAYLDFHVLDEHRSDIGTVTDHSPNEFTFDVWTFPGELRMTCRPGWVGRERLAAIGETFIAVLTAMAEDADADPQAFRAPGLDRPGATAPATRPLPEVCVPELVAERSDPDAIALEDAERSLTYREVDTGSNQLAHLLRGLGVGPETPVAICLDRGVEAVLAMLGVLKAGGYYVPLDPAYPDARIGFVLDDVRADVVICRPEDTDRLARIADLRCVPLDAAWTGLAVLPETPVEAGTHPDNLAYVTYTSGSTGRPKGVQVTHRAVVRLVHDPNYADLDPGQVLLLHAPLAFDASTLEVWGALGNGARLAVCPPGATTAAELAEVLRRHRVTLLWLTAGLFQHMVETEPAALAGVRQVLAGGDALSPAHVRTALGHGVALTNGYGPTECTTFSTALRGVTGADADRGVPIGVPITDTRVLVVDDHLDPVPFGVAGELLVGGPGLARGYLGRPDLTADRFVPDPSGELPGARFYRTGDIVRRDPDGTLSFVGRRDNQVKIRGHRVELAEVEAMIGGLAPVRAAAAAVHPGPDGQKRLVGYVVPEPGSGPLDVAALREQLRRRVPDYLVPGAWVELPALPLTAHGKIDRAALPEPSGPAPTAGSAAPRTATERAVAEVWAEVLGLGQVGVDDDFYLLGGHSLAILRITALLRERHGIDLTVRSFVADPTVAGLAAAVDAAAAGEPVEALVWLRREGSRPPLFCVHPGGGSAHWYRPLVPYLDPDQPVAAFAWPGLQAENGQPVPSTEQMAERYLAELRAAAPQGPYRLFGWCGGSGIASELAHRLTAEGEEVTFVLLDPGLDNHERPELWKEYRLIESCVAKLTELAAAPAGQDTSALRGETLALLEHLVDDVDPEVGIVLPEHGAGEVWLPSARMWREVMEMCLTYRHRNYPGRLNLIASDELADGEHEVASGQDFGEYLTRWQELTGEVALHRIPGDHFGVMKPPHLGRLAETITAILADGGASTG